MVYLLCIILLGVVGFQIALILGAPFGRLTQGGQIEGALPPKSRVIAALSIVVLAAIALSMLSADGQWPNWPRWTAWLGAAVLAVSTLLNWVTPSQAERKLWGPVMAVTLILAVMVLV
ncbi:hypothetical protein [Primorskyibacter sp. S187A]|uniref:hypothetical protein n=1 Tax=Primorskyibacter sp. S187A TaxID=3415130 RepID=UPI003C7B3415